MDASGGPQDAEARRKPAEVIDLSRFRTRANRGGGGTAPRRASITDLREAVEGAEQQVRRRSVPSVDLEQLAGAGSDAGSGSRPPRVAEIDDLSGAPAQPKSARGSRPGRRAPRRERSMRAGSATPAEEASLSAEASPAEGARQPDGAQLQGAAPGRSRSKAWAPKRQGQAGERKAGEGKGPQGSEAEQVIAAKEICLRLLTDRARTRQELDQALRKRDTAPEVVAQVLDRFDEVGLIDDEAFAAAWTRSRHRSRGLARRAIAQELRRKGIAKEVADTALAEVDDAAEEGRARELVEARMRTMRTDTAEERAKAARRLVGMLARRGYPPGVAYRVVRAALSVRGADDEEFGPTGAE